MSQNELAHRVSDLRSNGNILESAYISHLELGRDYAKHPTPEMMGWIAQALEIPPEMFPEYRLWRVRTLLNERDDDAKNLPGVGYRTATKNLAALARGEVPEAIRKAASEPPAEVYAALLAGEAEAEQLGRGRGPKQRQSAKAKPRRTKRRKD